MYSNYKCEIILSVNIIIQFQIKIMSQKIEETLNDLKFEPVWGAFKNRQAREPAKEDQTQNNEQTNSDNSSTNKGWKLTKNKKILIGASIFALVALIIGLSVGLSVSLRPKLEIIGESRQIKMADGSVVQIIQMQILDKNLFEENTRRTILRFKAVNGSQRLLQTAQNNQKDHLILEDQGLVVSYESQKQMSLHIDVQRAINARFLQTGNYADLINQFQDSLAAKFADATSIEAVQQQYVEYSLNEQTNAFEPLSVEQIKSRLLIRIPKLSVIVNRLDPIMVPYILYSSRNVKEPQSSQVKQSVGPAIVSDGSSSDAQKLENQCHPRGTTLIACKANSKKLGFDIDINIRPFINIKIKW